MTGISAPARRGLRLCAVVLSALVAAVLAQGYVSAPARAGTNPGTVEIRAKLREAAVARDIPPKILYGIAFQESTWRQFDADGGPLMSPDGGIGIMQVTSYGSYDVARLKADIDYNIAAGAEILLGKWRGKPLIGDGDRRCYENWFYAVWAYNGWVAHNEYPYRIWRHVAAGPEGWWTGVPVTPVPKSALVDGFGVATPTPQPAHYWSATPLPRPQLGAPRAPARVAAGARFTVSGTLSPRHLADGHSVEIRCYRSNGSTWVLRRSVLATNRDAGDATRYVATFGLGKAGRWRLRAHAPADAEHAAVSSALRYVRVR